VKRALMGIAAVASLAATPAFAIDPGFDWSGFYVGANVGYSWGRSSSVVGFNDATSGALLSSSPVKFDMNGVIGGGQAGYNWQRSNWVFGLEGDIQGSGQSGGTSAICAGGTAAVLNGSCTVGHIGDTAPFNIPGFPVANSLTEKLQWFGTLRGRVGPAVTPNVLVYVTGGLAYGGISATDAVSGTNIVGPQNVNGATLVPVAASFSKSTTNVGWTAGAGVEGAIGGNWTARLEYLYLDLGNISGRFVTPIVAPSGALVIAGYSSHITDNILRVGVNYKFASSPAPR
jgi:outer membrane immunogenic protein